MDQNNDIWTRLKTVSDALGIKEATFRVWKCRGSVPAKHHFPIVKKAEEIGVYMSFKLLHSMEVAE